MDWIRATSRRVFPKVEKRGKLRLLAAKDSSNGAVEINQDAKLYVTLLSPGQKSNTFSLKAVTAGCRSRKARSN